MTHDPTDKPDTTIQVNDKRRLDEQGEDRQPEREGACPEEGPTASAETAGPPDRECARKRAEEASQRNPEPPPPIDFSTLVYSFATQALVQLGEAKIPNEETRIDLTSAKQSIDILEILEKKTKGNLTEGEDHLLQNLLYDLRLRYVKRSRTAS